MWSLRNTTDKHRGRERKIKIKTERKANHKRLLNTHNKLRVAGGMGIKGGTWWDEHWVLYME